MLTLPFFCPPAPLKRHDRDEEAWISLPSYYPRRDEELCSKLKIQDNFEGQTPSGTLA
jgi:hypothetical protein